MKKLSRTPPPFCEGIEQAFETVEKLNKEALQLSNQQVLNDWRYSYMPPIKVCAVVVTNINGRKFIAFAGDEKVQMYVGMTVLEVPVRYMIPISEVLDLLNQNTAHHSWSDFLKASYSLEFNFLSPSNDEHSIIRLYKKTYTQKEVLAHSLLESLISGSGMIPRKSDFIQYSSSPNDECVKILIERAERWMTENNFSAFP